MYHIKGINVVGDYLYFIAGEEVGYGKMIKSPYNIYMMKTDGTGLKCVLEGDFFELLAHKDGFYALSYSKGLINFDRYFAQKDVISSDYVVSIQPFDDVLYYTVKEDPTYCSNHILYSYDGKNSTNIMEDALLKTFLYDNIEFYLINKGGYTEVLYYIDKKTQKRYTIKFDDIRSVYGKLGNDIIYSYNGKSGQECFNVYDVSKNREVVRHLHWQYCEFSIESLCYEADKMLVKTQDGYALSNTKFEIEMTIDIPDINIEQLQSNQSLMAINDDEDFYSDEEIIIFEDCFWYYSYKDINVTIEKRFLEDVDCNVYIAHVRSKSDDTMKIDTTPESIHALYNVYRRAKPDELAIQYKAILASNGDFFNEEDNPWTGISIRDGIVYKKRLERDMMAIFPDGSLKCFRHDDEITVEDLLSQGVQDTLSFGPILITDDKPGKDINTSLLHAPNPRNAVGMVEIGHYVNIMADGRQSQASAGLSFNRYAELFFDEGCSEAYNLDGGQTASIIFMGHYLNTHKHDYVNKFFRNVDEIVYFGYSDKVPLKIAVTDK